MPSEGKSLSLRRHDPDQVRRVTALPIGSKPTGRRYLSLLARLP
jgi:hypothetical protein